MGQQLKCTVALRGNQHDNGEPNESWRCNWESEVVVVAGRGEMRLVLGMLKGRAWGLRKLHRRAGQLVQQAVRAAWDNL